MYFYPIFKGFLVGLIIAIPTGPVGFLCAKRALTKHWHASVVSALGSIVADLIFGLIVIFGITSVLHFFTHEHNTIRLFGGLLLIYIGIKTFFDVPPEIVPGLKKYEHLGNFTSTFSLTITNPIQIVTLPLVFSAIGTGVAPDNFIQATFFILGLAIGSCVTWVIFIAVASALKKYIQEHHFSLINKISGGLILATGLFILGTVLFRHGI